MSNNCYRHSKCGKAAIITQKVNFEEFEELVVIGLKTRLGRLGRSQGTKNIIQALEKVGIRRFICQSTLGAGDSWGNLNFYWKYIMFGFILRKVFADHQRQEQYG